MYSFDFQGNLDNFYLAGEWAKFNVDRQCGAIVSPTCSRSTDVIDHPTFEGWYVEGTWILTGEAKPYTTQAINNEVGAFGNPIPSRPFSLDGESWGTWELTARYSDMNLNWHQTQVANTTQLGGILGGDERIVTLGVNWYLNRNIKLQVNDMIVKVKRGSSVANLNSMSQDLNILGVRLAFAN
jgi:phosphate-selective porin OprO/OprP